MIVGVGVGDATAARRYPVEAALVERLEHRDQCAGPRHLLWVEELLTAAELAGGDIVLNVRNHHRDDREGLGYASGFGDHSDLHHLRLDLPEAGRQRASGIIGDEDSGRTHQGINDIAHPKYKLLNLTAYAGAHDRLV